jgi:hypothetical protein
MSAIGTTSAALATPTGGLDDPAIRQELDDISRAVIGLGAQREYLTRGYVRLDGLWSGHLTEALAAEARATHSLAVLPEARPGAGTTLPGNRAPARQVTVAQAPLLASLHRSLTRVVQALSAKMVTTSVGTYGYYEHDDGCYLHLDADWADVTFLISVLGRLGPLHMHSELIGADTSELEALETDPRWDSSSGEPISYPSTGVAAIRGRILPHHRPPSPVSGMTAVAAIQYRALF